jgi:hypothetical protein
VYVTTHPHSIAVCGAFAAGCGWPLARPGPLQAGPVAVYGRLRGCNDVLQAARAEGCDWYLIDRGYFRATRDSDYTGYFRVTRNAMQHDGRGSSTGQRFARLGLPIRDWRRTGSHVLVCPPTDIFGRLSGFDAGAWTEAVRARLSAHTDREIRVREKPRGGGTNAPLQVDLRDCWALVTHSSNAAVEALLRGVPVFCTDPCAAQAMGRPDPAQIEHPAYPDDRHRWASVLADQQWLLSEMRDGLAWEMLNA